MRADQEIQARQELREYLDSIGVYGAEQNEIISGVVEGVKSGVDDGSAKIWAPHPKNFPQQMAYDSEAYELFYGGAAGGGKTDLLWGTATTQHKNSIIFRRIYKELRGATGIIARTREVLSKFGAVYNIVESIWRNIPGGRTLEFGACQYEHDKQGYRGRAHDFKGFDEITGFTESQYDFLKAWTRTTDLSQRTRVIACGNPPSTHDGEWVRTRWAAWIDDQHPNPAKPGEIRWYARIGDEDVEVEDESPIKANPIDIIPRSRTFIPARVQDNPYLRDGDYISTLMQLPELLRKQMLDGDFNAGVEDHREQLIPTAWIDAAIARWKKGDRPKNERGEPLKLTAIGCDVARGGRAQTTAIKRYGNWFDRPSKVPGLETPSGKHSASVVMRCFEANEDKAHTPIYIDLTGIGSSPYDILVANDFLAYAFIAAGKSTKTDRSGRFRFRNKRSEVWWLFREALDPEFGADIMLPPDTQLRSDLCAPRWWIGPRGIQVEDKESIFDRLKRSTDVGDAAVMSLQDVSASDFIRFLS